MEKMPHFYCQCLLLSALLAVMLECSDISTVTASQEEDVYLPCFKPDKLELNSCYRVKWMKFAADTREEKVILTRPKTPKTPDAERVKWNESAQMSLFMTTLKKSDEGLYRCEVWQDWDPVIVKKIFLKVKECKVLSPVKATHGTHINLTCPVDMESGQQEPQNVTWAILKGRPVPVHSEGIQINRTSLTIQSVDYSHSSWYRCTYMQTHRCFDINLQVQAENAAVATTGPATDIIKETRKQGSSGVFIGLTASAVGAIALVAALIGLFMYRRRNDQRAAEQRGHPADPFDGYEAVGLEPGGDPFNQLDNSLCQEFLEENICSFHY